MRFGKTIDIIPDQFGSVEIVETPIHDHQRRVPVRRYEESVVIKDDTELVRVWVEHVAALKRGEVKDIGIITHTDYKTGRVNRITKIYTAS